MIELNERLLAGMSLSGRERHCVYLNTGGADFANVSAGSGLDFPDDGRGLAATDWDFDGDVDLWISNRTAPRLRFLRNDLESGNRFVAFRLTGNGTSSNRDAIGARLTLRMQGVARDGDGDGDGDGVELIRTLRAAEGFLSQSSKWVHFGLGATGEIESLEVRWPDGARQVYGDIQAGHFFELEQGEGRVPTAWTPPDRTRDFRPTEPVIAPSTQAMRLIPGSAAALPRMQYRDLAGEVHVVGAGAESGAQSGAQSREPFLLNLWASWCVPCRAELADLARADFPVLALSVDGLGEGGAGGAGAVDGAEAARAFIDSRGLDLPVGMADERIIGVLQTYHDTVFLNRRPLPLPTSFLIDADGSVGAIYKGRVDLDTVRRDLAHLGDDVEAQRERATPFTGRWLEAARGASPEALQARLIEKGYLDPP